MNKKEKSTIYIVIIIVLVIILKKVLSVTNITYKIKNENGIFSIRENYDKKRYHLEISNENRKYLINIYNDLKGSRKIVNKIYNYNDKKYQCILPIMSGEVLTDVICYKGNMIYNYNQIKGENDNLDNYVSTIKEYKKNVFGNKNTYNLIDTIKLYDNKINRIVSTTSYKGLFVNGMEINLFKKDVYNNKISTFINNYYLIADYNSEYEFKFFYLVNLKNSEVEKIEVKDSISFDSYIQGIVDNKVYLYDIDNEVQYEIDILSKKVNVVSSHDYIKYYTNTKWEKLSKSKVKRSTYFDYSTLNNDFTNYDYVKYSEDYYYLLNEENKNYKIYRVDNKNLDIITYIGIIPTTDIRMNNEYFYYTYDNTLYFYSDRTGFKTILENTEKEFNDSIKYYVY